MAQGYAKELVGVLDGTLTVAGKSDGRVQGGDSRSWVATLDLSQAAVAKASGDTNVLFRLPAGYKPIRGLLTSTVSLGAATVAIGTAASPGKYRTAATFTATDTPTPFMNGAAAAQDPLAAEEDVIVTIAAAALPGAGLVTIVMEACGR